MLFIKSDFKGVYTSYMESLFILEIYNHQSTKNDKD